MKTLLFILIVSIALALTACQTVRVDVPPSATVSGDINVYQGGYKSSVGRENRVEAEAVITPNLALTQP